MNITNFTADGRFKIKDVAASTGGIKPNMYWVSQSDPSADYSDLEVAVASVASGSVLLLDAEVFNPSTTIQIDKDLSVFGTGFGGEYNRTSVELLSTTVTKIFEITASSVVIELANLEVKLSAATTIAGNYTAFDVNAPLVSGRFRNCAFTANGGASTGILIEKAFNSVGANTLNFWNCTFESGASGAGVADAYALFLQSADTAYIHGGYFRNYATVGGNKYACYSTGSLCQFYKPTVAGSVFGTTGSFIDSSGEVDLNGLNDGLILDADGDTTISAPIDDQIDVEIGGADVLTVDANDATFDVNIALSKPHDIYPGGDNAPFTSRLFGLQPHSTVTYEFNDSQDYTTAPSPWAWESTDFDGAPVLANTTTYTSVLTLASDNSAKRHFLYQSGSVSSLLPLVWSRCILNQYIGVRFDDGTDNNYFEGRVKGLGSGLSELEVEYRSGGGVIVNNSAISGLLLQEPVLLYLVGASKQLQYSLPFCTQYSFTLGSGISFTIARYGIVFGGSSATNVLSYVDKLRVI